MRKIAFVSPVPLTDKLRRDWCVDSLIAAGARVEYWEATSLWGYRPEERETAASGIEIRIGEFRELRRRFALAENKTAIFVVPMNYEARYHQLFRLLTRLDRTMCIFEWGHFPTLPPSKPRKLLDLAGDPAALMGAVSRKILTAASRRLGLIKPFDLVFAAGESALRRHPNAGRIVPINMCDYEDFKTAARDSKRSIPGRYGLFLDSNHALSPDRAFVGMAPIDADRYFASLNRFFGLLEKKFGFPVAVALHPKSAYGSERFEGRKALAGAAPALAKDAEFVVGHTTTSMSYAVLAEKPIVYLYTGDMALATPDYVEAMAAPADYLRRPLLDIDTISSPEEIVVPPADAERYDRYKYDFLASRQSESDSTRNIVIRELARL